MINDTASRLMSGLCIEFTKANPKFFSGPLYVYPKIQTAISERNYPPLLRAKDKGLRRLVATQKIRDQQLGELAQGFDIRLRLVSQAGNAGIFFIRLVPHLQTRRMNPAACGKRVGRLGDRTHAAKRTLTRPLV